MPQKQSLYHELQFHESADHDDITGKIFSPILFLESNCTEIQLCIENNIVNIFFFCAAVIAEKQPDSIVGGGYLILFFLL